MASTSHAQGFSFDGATIEGRFVSNVDAGTFDSSQTGLYGSAQGSFGNIGVQIDLDIFGYDSASWRHNNYAVHAFYQISPNLVAGAYFGQDKFKFFSNDIYSTYGVEAKFNPGFAGGRFTFEGFAGAYQSHALGGETNPMIGLGIEYAVNDSIDVGGSYLRGAWDDLSNPADRYDVLELEATYTFGSGVFATASYTNTFGGATPNWDEATYGIAIGFNFGDGTTFREYPKLCVWGLAHAIETGHLLNRSGYRIANWFLAATHSLTQRPFFSNLRIAR